MLPRTGPNAPWPAALATVRDPEAIRARLAAHASGVSRGRAAATGASRRRALQRVRGFHARTGCASRPGRGAGSCPGSSGGCHRAKVLRPLTRQP